MTEVTKQGVPCFSGSCSEIYLEKAFAEAGFGLIEERPMARQLTETSLAFLVHPTLGDHHIQSMIPFVGQVLNQATASGQA
jgi:dTDP-4-amino-4,6-dideoxygalactose transaminase